MQVLRRRDLLLLLSAANYMAWGQQCWPQEAYPSRPVTIVVPHAAGTAPDSVARLLADRLSTRLGKPFIVDDRGGANGIPALEYLARSANDGYTLLLGTSSPLVANPHIYRNLKYDPTRLTSVAVFGTAPMALVVAADSPLRSLDDLLRSARERPGKLTYGASNTGSQVITERLKLRANIDVLRVPYRATPQVITDLLGGRIDILFVDLPVVLPGVKNNQLRALAVSGSTRTQLLPNVPTLPELGYPDLVLTLWLGLFGPDHLPDSVKVVLENAVAAIVAEEVFKERMTSSGLDVTYLSDPKASAFVTSELRRWGDLVQGAGIEFQD